MSKSIKKRLLGAAFVIVSMAFFLYKASVYPLLRDVMVGTWQGLITALPWLIALYILVIGVELIMGDL
jgi:hypothetical protein